LVLPVAVTIYQLVLLSLEHQRLTYYLLEKGVPVGLAGMQFLA
jgi:hypothetical protein